MPSKVKMITFCCRGEFSSRFSKIPMEPFSPWDLCPFIMKSISLTISLLTPKATSLASFSINILWITLLKHLKPCRDMNNFMVWEWNSQTFSYLAHLRNDLSLVEILLVTKLIAIAMGDHKKIEGTVVFSVVGRPNAILTSKNAIWVCVKYKIVLIKKFNSLVLKLYFEMFTLLRTAPYILFNSLLFIFAQSLYRSNDNTNRAPNEEEEMLVYQWEKTKNAIIHFDS